MDKPLTGQVAFVTGASGGLGLRFARILSEAGAAVALAARRIDRLEAEAEGLRSAGGKAVAVTLDVSDPAAIGPALDEAEAALGPISIMINNAGIGGRGLALDVSVEVWDETYAVNVRGVFFGAREAARRMIASGVAARGDARIINISSIGAHTVLPGLSAYTSSKAAVAMMTRALAREWARPGIAVNALCPGFIETDLNSDWFQTDAGQKQMNAFPRRRLMAEDGLDDALLMLAGPTARAITGSVITLDDGQTL